MKTKDYLGKARLVAASDRANAFTGFAGSEIKNAGKSEGRDDRPPDNISFAATNLVKPGLSSRRQAPEGQSASFPPTPPPENERPARSGSVRSGSRPALPKLNIQQAEPNRRYEKAISPPDSQHRPTPTKSIASPERSFSQRRAAPPPLQRRPPPAQKIEEEAYPEEVYDMYRAPSHESRHSGGSRRRGQSRRPQPRYSEEEEASEYDGSFDEGDFEMVSGNRRGTGSSRNSRRPEINKARIKVHAEDVRCIMVGVAIEFPDLVDKIRDKFGLRRRFKIKIKDEDMPEGDMITMGDQDDLEMAMTSAKSLARKQRQDIAKMEVCGPTRSTHLNYAANHAF